MDISIIIVSYNVKEFLRGALKSVERALDAGKLTGEIFVVDNDSGDESAIMVRDEFPSVRLHALRENLGFGRANNLAMRDATGDYLLLLNPDTIVGEDTLRFMVDFMRANPNAGLSGCKLLNGDGTFQLSCRRGFPTPWASFTKLFGLAAAFPKSKLFAQYNLTYLPDDATYEVDALGGAFMMLSQAAYKATKGFDEDYFMYGEDLDLCFRVKKSGFAVFYVHGTATIHFKGESTRRSAINEVAVFYEAMHIFVKKNYGSSFLFRAMLRLGIFLRTLLALAKKYRGALVVAAVDAVLAVMSTLIVTRTWIGGWFALPQADYPYVLLIPPLITVGVLAGAGAYRVGERRRAKTVLTAMPITLVFISTLTYFFKDFASSRSLVLITIAVTTFALILGRAAFRLMDRIRFGGANSARPSMNRTLVVGTSKEAIRIAELLRRTAFTRRYQIIGFIDRTLTNLHQELLPDLRILGDTNMLAKVVRDERISEVIFASDSVPYSEMLMVMQRISSEELSRPVNFNMVPHASDVLLGRSKIEFLPDPSAGDPVALIPVEYNIQRISHRFAKRMIDIAMSLVAIPALGLLEMLHHSTQRAELLREYKRVLQGDYSLVGCAKLPASRRQSLLSKPGITSLAAITLAHPDLMRPEDVEQLDLYYAQHHTIGMDMEILFRTLFSSQKKRA